MPLLPEVRFTRCTAPAGGRAFVTLDHLHWITSGATSFARGLNDAPKMVALLLGASALSGGSSPQTLPMFLAVAAGMAFGSAFAGRRVTNVLACDVVRMTHHEGFTANLVTAALVGPGAALGIPMSTTHVSAGAIMGIGATEEFANTRVIRNMLLAWFVTVPFAALLGIAVLIALRAAGLH